MSIPLFHKLVEGLIPWKLPHLAYSGCWKPWFPIIFTMKSVHSHLPGAPSTGANLRAEALLWGSLGRWRLEWHKHWGIRIVDGVKHGQFMPIQGLTDFDLSDFVVLFRRWSYSVHFFPLNLLTPRYEILTCFKPCHLLASGWRFTKPLGFTRLCRSLAGAIPFWRYGLYETAFADRWMHMGWAYWAQGRLLKPVKSQTHDPKIEELAERSGSSLPTH